MTLRDQFENLDHHAYAVIGDESIQVRLIEILEEKYSVRSNANQDFHVRRYETFTIDDARDLKVSYLTRPVDQGGKKVFLLEIDAITIEAQNALLKLLEEPTEYTHFFMIIPSIHLLLPTIVSRLCIIDPGDSFTPENDKSGGVSEISTLADKFIRSGPAKRLELIKVFLGDITKEKRPKRDAITLLNTIQSSIYKDKGVKDGRETLESIETVRRYMDDRSPSLKMLLEYVALRM